MQSTNILQKIANYSFKYKRVRQNENAILYML